MTFTHRPTRRQFTLGLGSVALSLGAPQLSLAVTGGEARFVVVVLRGALDGLAAVVPYADRYYRSARGGLALSERDGLLDLDGRFALHPALKRMHGRYGRGELAIVHATATGYRDRSHFDAQKILENGTTDARIRTGWLNRAAQQMALRQGPAPAPPTAFAPALPLILQGEYRATNLAPGILPPPSEDLTQRLAGLYQDDALLGPAFTKAVSRFETTGMVKGDNMGPRAVIDLAKLAGQALADSKGARIAMLEMGGFDTHAGQGTVKGRLANQLEILDEALEILAQATGSAWRRTVVLALTEFGRTVHENGTAGSDHGTGSAAFVLGGAVHGGRVAGAWPGLAKAKLYQGRDLAPANDTNDLIAAALQRHLALSTEDLNTVLPGHRGAGGFADLFGRA